MKEKNEEFENFDSTMTDLLKVPHSEIKAKLDAEKEQKEKRGKKLPRGKGNEREDSRSS